MTGKPFTKDSDISEMEVKIKKQLPKGVSQKVLSKSASGAKNGLFSVAVIQILAQGLLKKGMDDLIMMYFALQLIDCFSSLKIKRPANLNIGF